MLRWQACVCTPGFLHRCFVCKPRPLKLCGNCSYPLNHLPRTEGKLLGNYYASINVIRVCSAVCVCVSMFMSVGVYMWMSKVRAMCYVKILKLYHFLKHTFIVWIYVCMLVHMQREKENSGKLFFFFPLTVMEPSCQTCGKHLCLWATSSTPTMLFETQCLTGT